MHQLVLAPGRRGRGQRDQDRFPRRTVLNSSPAFCLRDSSYLRYHFLCEVPLGIPTQPQPGRVRGPCSVLHFPCGTVRSNISVVLSRRVMQSQDTGTESEEETEVVGSSSRSGWRRVVLLPTRGGRREAAGWNCGQIQRATRTL